MARKKIGLVMVVGLFGIMACSLFPVSLLGDNIAQPTPNLVPPTEVVFPTMVSVPTKALKCPTCPDCDPLNCPTPLAPTQEVQVENPTITIEPTNVPEAKVADPIKSAMPYQLMANSPLYEQNTTNLNIGCSWMGIAGQAFDQNENPVPNLVVSVEGVLNGIPIEHVGVTGANKNYGPGGYEIVLSNKTFASTGALKITLLDLHGGALSDSITIDTYDDCQKNLIMLNYKQVPQ